VKAELIQSARRRLASTGKKTRRIDLRRAVSDTYYALFHALAQCCADELIGKTHRKTEAWVRTYRALDHKQAKTQLKALETKHKKIKATGGEFVFTEFALAFGQFQDHRHSADYNPEPFGFDKNMVIALVNRAETLIADFDKVDSGKKRKLATDVLFKDRN
jgi:hypothetical protein